MSTTELRQLPLEDLAEREVELGEEVARLTMRRNARRLDKPSELKNARRELARVLTIKRERTTSVGAEQ